MRGPWEYIWGVYLGSISGEYIKGVYLGVYLGSISWGISGEQLENLASLGEFCVCAAPGSISGEGEARISDYRPSPPPPLHKYKYKTNKN